MENWKNFENKGGSLTLKRWTRFLSDVKWKSVIEIKNFPVDRLNSILDPDEDKIVDWKR